MIKQVTSNVTSGLSWSLLQGTLEHQLPVLVGQLQIHKLSRPKLKVFVELHQIEMVLCLSRLHVDL
jgi:hypothetical protein